MSTPYELLARFNKDGTVAGCHVRTLTTVDGKDYESDPVPLKDATDKAFTQFVEAFAANLLSERDSLAKDKAQLVADAEIIAKRVENLQQSAAQLLQVTTEKEAVIAELNKLQEEKAKLISDAEATAKQIANTTESNTKQIADLTKDLTEASATQIADLNEVNARQIANITESNTKQIASLTEVNAKQIADLTESNTEQLASVTDELNATKKLLATAQQTIADQTDRATKLVAALPFNPRLIKVDAFLVRVKNEMFDLGKDSLTDAQSKNILSLLVAKKDSKPPEPVNLDSPNLTGALQYLIERGRLTENRAKEIMQDATRDEAYMESIT